jgi:dihydroneopterin aldolase
MRFHCIAAEGCAHDAFAMTGISGEGLARRRFDVQLLGAAAGEKDVSDYIHIEQMEVFAHIGVPTDERASPQRLTFNITLWPACNAPELGDEIGRTVNYAVVCTETKNFVRDRSDRLIETLADALASHLLEVFEIRRITIELRKFILPDVEFVSMTVTRDRSTK